MVIYVTKRDKSVTQVIGKSYISQPYIIQSCNTKKIIKDSRVGNSIAITCWPYGKYIDFRGD